MLQSFMGGAAAMSAVPPFMVTERVMGGVRKSDNDVWKSAGRRMWDTFQRCPTEGNRHALIEHYQHLVKITASRMNMPDGRDDAQGAGSIGLIRAVDTFRPEKGVKFESWAITNIRGEILEQARNADWVPRSVRTLSKQVDAARQNVTETQGRSPTDDELRTELCYSEDDWAKVQAILLRQSPALSLDHSHAPDDSLTFADLLADESPDVWEQAGLRIDMSLLNEIVDVLPSRERAIIRLYHWEQMGFREIGQRIGLSESRVYQIYWEGLGRMKKYLNKRIAG
jgi:RNA polymerase sigma factor for flagellar operon FliA